jgi:malate permease and related proteins
LISARGAEVYQATAYDPDDVTGAAQLLLQIFASDLLPVFAIAGVGFLLAKYGGVQVRTVSRMTFHSLVTSTLSGDQFWRMVLFYLLVAGAAAVMARLAAIPLRLDRRALSAFMLVVVCSNSGNYGLPVAQLAFGREALAFASVYFVSSSMFTYTGGVLLAASGRRSLMSALKGVLTVPAFYAAVAAVLALSAGIQVPDVIMRPVGMLSDAALPMMIVVLGMQLERATMPERPGVVAVAVFVSLVLTPIAAIGLAHLIGLRGAALQAGVLQSSMPTAVMTTILALEFDALPQFVTSVVCFATLLSPLTVTLLIAYLQRSG